MDRQRVAEITLRILMNHFDSVVVLQDPVYAGLYMQILLNMAWFSNVQVPWSHLHRSSIDLCMYLCIYLCTIYLCIDDCID